MRSALDVLAFLFGLDSRDNHDRAVDAARRGDLRAFRTHMNAPEREIARMRRVG